MPCMLGQNRDMTNRMSANTAPLTRRILSVFDDTDEATRNAGELWYQDANARCLTVAEEFGIRHAQAIGIVAALSPNMRWERNIIAAEEFLSGNMSVTYPANVGKACGILNGRDPLDVLGGPKVRSFYVNILSGGWDESVTVDGHASNIARGIRQPIAQTRVTARQYRIIAQAYRNAATRRGLTPPAMQATVWLAWRDSEDAIDIRRPHN